MITIHECHDWILGILKKNYGGFLSPNNIDRAINSASTDLFNQIVKNYKETNNLPDYVKAFKKDVTTAISSGEIPITGIDSEVIAVSTIINQQEFPARIAMSDQEFNSRKYSDMEMDGIDNNPLHYYKRQEEYVLTASSSQLQDLPEDFIRHIKIFYKDGQNNLHEGDILSDREFTERLQSKIIPPITEEPIARIVNNQIEFWPKPAGTDEYTYVLSHYQYPVPERALVRIYGDDSNNQLRIECTPTETITELKAYYLEKPTKGIFGYTQVNGVITYDAATSVDLTWGQNAFNELMTMSLFYLGYTLKDGEAVSITPSRDSIEANKDQMRGGQS